MCRLAVERGLAEIAFSDHLDSNPVDECYGLFIAADFCGEVDECRERYGDRLRILKSAELGEPHLYVTEIENVIGDEPFDFLTGAIHWVGDDIVSVDCKAGQADQTSSASWVSLYDRYFDDVLRAVECANFDVLAHLDLAKRFGVNYLGAFDVELYREQIEAILRTMIDRAIALEVNTSGYRQPCREPFPGLETLRLYRQLGGELITVGSDAHRSEHLGLNIEAGLALIRSAGFRSITLYRDRVPSQMSL
jgi:histidinol-phosphatase (PHP family)